MVTLVLNQNLLAPARRRLIARQEIDTEVVTRIGIQIETTEM